MGSFGERCWHFAGNSKHKKGGFGGTELRCSTCLTRHDKKYKIKGSNNYDQVQERGQKSYSN